MLVSKQKLKLAKLRALEPTRTREETPEREKRHRRHRLKHIDLLHHRLQDGQHALERCARRLDLIRDQALRESIAFMQLLLKPQLVHLVNDDEEHLVVLKSSRRRIVRRGDLQREKFRNFEVTAVGDLHAASVAKAAELISELTLADSPSDLRSRSSLSDLRSRSSSSPESVHCANPTQLAAHESVQADP